MRGPENRPLALCEASNWQRQQNNSYMLDCELLDCSFDDDDDEDGQIASWCFKLDIFI